MNRLVLSEQELGNSQREVTSILLVLRSSFEHFIKHASGIPFPTPELALEERSSITFYETHT